MILNNNILKNNYKRNIFILLFLIFISLLFFSINNFYSYFSFDEAYSIILVDNSFSEIIKLTSQDVHPPLYYILLKIFIIFFGDTLIVMRTLSLLGFALTLSLCFVIRVFFGDRASILYVLLLLLIPLSQYLTVEIRMYSWCMFLLTTTMLLAYISFIYNRLKYWLLLAFLGALSSYTHNFGLVSVAVIYGLLCLTILCSDKKKSLIIYFLLSLIICLILYIPWFVVLMNQIKVIVVNGYWIPKITVSQIIQYPLFIFDVGKKETIIDFSLYLLSFIFYFLLVYSFFQSISLDRKKYFALLCLIVFASISIVGVIISYFLYRPIFVPRYMSVGLGIFVLGISIIFSDLKFKRNSIKMIFFILLLLLFSHTCFKFYFVYSMHKYKEYNKYNVDQFLHKNLSNKSIFLYNQEPYSFEDYFRLRIRYPNFQHILYNDDVSSENKILGSIPKESSNVIFSKKAHGYYQFPTKIKQLTIEDLEENYIVLDSILSYEGTILYSLKQK